MKTTNILIAPLNWGLGHATRCVPIIKALIEEGFNPIIASDGNALSFLKSEFSHLTFEELPSYNVKYSKHKFTFVIKILLQLPKIYLTIKKENKILSEIVLKHNIKGIISDNRLGIYKKNIPSIYMTHQTKVFSGIFTNFSSKLHQYFINKHTECWIPDSETSINLSGILSHNSYHKANYKFIGPISRFTNFYPTKKYDYCAILSGPEPQRTILENIIKNEFKKTNKTTAIIGCNNTNTVSPNIQLYPVLNTEELELLIHQSEVVISRSGYTTIMDLAYLNKKCLLIPTPGQKEQEYLAKKLKREGLVVSVSQEKFTLKKLNKINLYHGFRTLDYSKKWSELFKIFC